MFGALSLFEVHFVEGLVCHVIVPMCLHINTIQDCNQLCTLIVLTSKPQISFPLNPNQESYPTVKTNVLAEELNLGEKSLSKKFVGEQFSKSRRGRFVTW